MIKSLEVNIEFKRFGFFDVVIIDFIERCIEFSNKYWSANGDEDSWYYAISVQEFILRIALKYGHFSPLANYIERIKASLMVQILDSNEDMWLTEWKVSHEDFSYEELHSICDELLRIINDTGSKGFSPGLYNMLIFYENVFWTNGAGPSFCNCSFGDWDGLFSYIKNKGLLVRNGI